MKKMHDAAGSKKEKTLLVQPVLRGKRTLKAVCGRKGLML